MRSVFSLFAIGRPSAIVPFIVTIAIDPINCRVFYSVHFNVFAISIVHFVTELFKRRPLHFHSFPSVILEPIRCRFVAAISHALPYFVKAGFRKSVSAFVGVSLAAASSDFSSSDIIAIYDFLSAADASVEPFPRPLHFADCPQVSKHFSSHITVCS